VAAENGAPQLVEPAEFATNEIEASLIMLVSQLYRISLLRSPLSSSPRSSPLTLSLPITLNFHI
jgi:hypothetical protein